MVYRGRGTSCFFHWARPWRTPSRSPCWARESISALTYADYSLLSNGVALASKQIGFKYTDTENDPNKNWEAYSKSHLNEIFDNLGSYASELGFEKISEDTNLNTTVQYTLPEDLQQLKEKRKTISDANNKFGISLKTEVFAVGYSFDSNVWVDFYAPDFMTAAPKKFTQAIKVTAKDERGPVVVDVQAPQNTRPTAQKYAVGESYPITVTFDSPVKVVGDETLVVNKVVDDGGTVTNPGTTCEIVESPDTVTRTVTFLSYVKPGDGEGVLLNSMDGFTDISGKETESFDDSGDDFPTLTLQGVAESEQPHWTAIADVSVDAEGEDASYNLYSPGATEGTVTVTLDENKNVRSWLTQDEATDKDKVWEQNNAYVLSKVLGFSLDGGETILPLYIKSNEGGTPDLKGDFDLEINSTNDTQLYGLELYELNPTGEPAGENAPFFGSGVIFGTQPAIFLSDNDVALNYPDVWLNLEESGRIFADQLEEDFKLGFSVNLDDATWGNESLVTTLDKDGKPVVDPDGPQEYHFAWSSSDPDVATIDETGKITILTNGSVQFTLTALNGDLMLPDLDENGDPVIGENGETVLVTSRFDYQTPEILVGIGNSPTLTIPESLRTTTVRGGRSATVLWSSNLTEKNRDYAKEQKLENWETTATEFEVKVYKQGDWNTDKPVDGAQPVDEAITVSSSMESVKSSVTSGSSGPSSSTSPTATVLTGTTSKTTGRRCRTASPATTTRLYSRMKSQERQDPSCFL